MTVAGGSATAGGINFQTAVTGIVEVHAAVGARLDWLSGVAHDVPALISAETGGAGDDVGIRFADGTYAEVQVKRGLSAGQLMWDLLLRLAAALHVGSADYGVLVVCPDSSRPVRHELARDLQRLAGGRSDDLKPITQKFDLMLRRAGFCVNTVAQRLRIVTLNCLTSDSSSIGTAKALLAGICSSAGEVARLRLRSRPTLAAGLPQFCRRSGSCCADRFRADSVQRRTLLCTPTRIMPKQLRTSKGDKSES